MQSPDEKKVKITLSFVLTVCEQFKDGGGVFSMIYLHGKLSDLITPIARLEVSKFIHVVILIHFALGLFGISSQ